MKEMAGWMQEGKLKVEKTSMRASKTLERLSYACFLEKRTGSWS